MSNDGIKSYQGVLMASITGMNMSCLKIEKVSMSLMDWRYSFYRKTSAIGKHQTAITCGAFSNYELLALGSTDSTITVSSIDGELIYSLICNMEPSLIKFCDRKQPNDKNSEPNTMVSCNLLRSLIYIPSLHLFFSFLHDFYLFCYENPNAREVIYGWLDEYHFCLIISSK